MTGSYVRVNRNEKYVSIEIEYLTNAERAEYLKEATKEDTMLLLNFMCDRYLRLINAFNVDATGSDE